MMKVNLTKEEIYFLVCWCRAFERPGDDKESRRMEIIAARIANKLKMKEDDTHGR